MAGHDDLVAGAHPVGFQRDCQRVEAITHADAVSSPAIGREFLFEHRDFTAEDQTTARHDPVKGFVEFAPHRPQRLRHGQEFDPHSAA